MPKAEIVKARPQAKALVSVSDYSALIRDFLSGRSPRTMEAYRQDLAHFQAFLNVSRVDEAARTLLARGPGAANGVALRYKDALLKAGLKPATINRRLAAVRSLVAMGRQLGYVAWELEISNVPSRAYRDTRGPARTGVAAMLQALEGRTDVKGIRDRALIRLLYNLALRASEVVGLNVSDVDLTAGTVQVIGKGRREPVALTLPAPTRNALAEWLAARGTKPGPLFLNLDPLGKGQINGRRLSRISLYRLVRALGARVGLKTWPHGLRHAAITAALDQTNGNIRAVARFSRHSDLRTLNFYDDNRQDLGGEIANLIAL